MSFISKKLNTSRRLALQRNEISIASYWISIAYGNGRFVAISQNHKIAYSDDGINWNFLSDLSFNMNSIEYGNGKFIMVGSGIYVSSNGIDWSHMSSPYYGGKIKYLNNKFIFLGDDSSGDGVGGISVDGITWSYGSLNSPLGSLWIDVAYGAGYYVAISNSTSSKSSYSVDGVTWVSNSVYDNRIPAIQRGQSINYVNGNFILTNWDGNIYYSVNGIDFYTLQLSTLPRHYGVTYGGGKLVVVSSENGRIAYSNNGVTWVDVGIPINTKYYAVVYGDNKFVAVGVGRYSAYSSDAINWNSSNLKAIAGFTSIAYGADKFVAVGFNGSSVYSNDGKNWNISDSTILSNLYRVAYGNGKFVAIGSDGICCSDDGVNWITTNTSFKPTRVLAYGDGKFIADAGAGGLAKYSIDGITWTDTISLPLGPSAITYGNGLFVAVYRISNTTAFSSNGINWTNGGSLPSIDIWYSVAYDNNVFVAVGVGNKTAYSYNGVNWTGLNLSVGFQYLLAVAGGNGIFVAINNSGSYNLYGYGVKNWNTFSSGKVYAPSIAYGAKKFAYLGQISFQFQNPAPMTPEVWLLNT